MALLSCSHNWTTARFAPEVLDASTNHARFLFLLEETLIENDITVRHKLHNDENQYTILIDYIHPPGEPNASLFRNVNTGYQIRGELIVDPDADPADRSIVEITLKWQNDALGEDEVKKAFRNNVINDFMERLESE